MGDDRYDRGLARLRELAGEQGERVIERLAETSPDLARLIVEFGYGDVYSRSRIDDHTRQVAAISSLATMGGAEPQLEYHIGVALNVGVPPETIVETIVFLTPFLGLPRVLNAVRSVRRVFSARGIEPHTGQLDLTRRSRPAAAADADRLEHPDRHETRHER